MSVLGLVGTLVVVFVAASEVKAARSGVAAVRVRRRERRARVRGVVVCMLCSGCGCGLVVKRSNGN